MASEANAGEKEAGNELGEYAELSAKMEIKTNVMHLKLYT